MVAGLRHHLAHPALIETFVREYNAERQRLAKQANHDRPALERRLSAIDREIANLVEALKAGAGAAVPSIVASVKGLEAEKARLAADLAAIGAGRNVVAIHPRAVE